MIIDGLIVGGSVIVAALGICGASLLLRRDDTPPVDADVHVMRLKYGNTWGAQRIRAQLIAVGKLIEVADQQAPWPPAQPPAVTLHGAMHRQYPLPSPAAPAPPGAEQGTAAAAGSTRAPAPTPPPLPDPAYAAAHPGCWPLGWLQDDQFVTDWTAQAVAETEALVKSSYYKPLGGA